MYLPSGGGASEADLQCSMQTLHHFWDSYNLLCVSLKQLSLLLSTYYIASTRAAVASASTQRWPWSLYWQGCFLAKFIVLQWPPAFSGLCVHHVSLGCIFASRKLSLSLTARAPLQPSIPSRSSLPFSVYPTLLRVVIVVPPGLLYYFVMETVLAPFLQKNQPKNL